MVKRIAFIAARILSVNNKYSGSLGGKEFKTSGINGLCAALQGMRPLSFEARFHLAPQDKVMVIL